MITGWNALNLGIWTLREREESVNTDGEGQRKGAGQEDEDGQS